MREIPEGLLYELTGRTGDLPRPGFDRWAKAKKLKAGESYTFIQTGMLDIITPMALQLAFSIDGINFTPIVPITASQHAIVTVTKSVDVKSGAFVESFDLTPGNGMPICSLIARALTVTVQNVPDSGTPDLWVHAAACPTTMIDCGSITSNPDSPWNDVITDTFPANTPGNFVALPASNGAKQVIVQNNSAVSLYLGFGTFIPSPGPPPFSNLILPGGIHAIWESQLGAFIGAVNAAFGPGGLATDFATFTRGITL
jgi:hypothetical protein